MIRAPWGTAHSPAAPAQRIRSPRTTVTALVTGARPVPSHRVAPTMAIEGLTGAVGPAWPGARHRRRPPGRPARGTRVRRDASWAACSILPRATGADRGAANCPMRIQDANGRGGIRGDSEGVVRRDPGHQPGMRQTPCRPLGTAAGRGCGDPVGSLVLPPCPPPRSIVRGAGDAPTPCAGSCASTSSRPGT